MAAKRISVPWPNKYSTGATIADGEIFPIAWERIRREDYMSENELAKSRVLFIPAYYYLSLSLKERLPRWKFAYFFFKVMTGNEVRMGNTIVDGSA